MVFWLTCANRCNQGCVKDCDVATLAPSRFANEEWEPDRKSWMKEVDLDVESFIKDPAATDTSRSMRGETAIGASSLSSPPCDTSSHQRQAVQSTHNSDAINDYRWTLVKGLQLETEPFEQQPQRKPHDMLSPSEQPLQSPPSQVSDVHPKQFEDVFNIVINQRIGDRDVAYRANATNEASQQFVQSAPTPDERVQQQKQESLPNAQEAEQAGKENRQEREAPKQNSGEMSSNSSSIGKMPSLRERLPFWSNSDAEECGFFFFALGAFLEERAPNGQTWADYLAPVQPSFVNDNGKDLIGPWQECMHSAVVYENSHPRWQDEPEYRRVGPSQQVIEYFEACGHSDSNTALEQSRQNARKRLQSSGASGISSSRCSSRASSRETSIMSSRPSRMRSDSREE